MQVHIQNDGPVTIYLESPVAPINAKQVSFFMIGINIQDKFTDDATNILQILLQINKHEY